MEVQESKKGFCKYCSPNDEEGDITSETLLDKKINLPFCVNVFVAPSGVDMVKTIPDSWGFQHIILVDVSVSRERKELSVGLQSEADGEYRYVKREINYCPMCGRKL